VSRADRTRPWDLARAEILPLFPPDILEYQHVTDVREVTAPNASDAVFCSTDDGLQWVRKGDNALASGTLSECVGWSLAHIMGMSVPRRGAVFTSHQAGRVWMSEVVGNARTWRAGDYALLKDKSDLAWTLALDVVVDNGDRHSRNILLTHQPKGLMRFWAIDFDGAGVSNFGHANLSGEPCFPVSGASHCWLREMSWDALEPDVRLATQHVAMLVRRRSLIEQMASRVLRAARGYEAHFEAVDGLVAYLQWRSERAYSMAKSFWESANAK
jgi:hypothetical protein